MMMYTGYTPLNNESMHGLLGRVRPWVNPDPSKHNPDPWVMGWGKWWVGLGSALSDPRVTHAIAYSWRVRHLAQLLQTKQMTIQAQGSRSTTSYFIIRMVCVH